MTLKFNWFIFGCLLCSVNSINFYLRANDRRCIQEEIKKDVLVIGEYEIKAGMDQSVKVLVTDSRRHVLVKIEEVKKPGKFSLALEKSDRIDFCFESVTTSRSKMLLQVSFAIKKGVETKKREELSQVGKLKPIEREMDLLEDYAYEILDLFSETKQREIKMSDTNESTSNRVFYLAVFNFLWLFSLAAAQILYLRWYFMSKKLIQ